MNDQQMPWLDVRLSKEAIDHLWDIINRTTQETDSKGTLAGNISKSRFIQDKDNWFFENVMKECIEYLYYKDWNNYYNVHVVKSDLPPVFELETIWVNYQKQHEFNPPHRHGGLYSFVVFMKIPTHWKEQHALLISANSNVPCASDFQFLIGEGQGPCTNYNLPLSPEDEGRMLFFPAWLQHQVFPFYGTEEERITISGNVIIKQEDDEMTLMNEKEVELERVEILVRSLKEMIKKEERKKRKKR